MYIMKSLYIQLNIILTKFVLLVFSVKDYNFFPNLPAVSIFDINLFIYTSRGNKGKYNN